MERSDEVRDAMLRFYDRVSANDASAFDSLVSTEPSTLVIGTAPGEWVRERERLRFGFEAEGLSIGPGSDPTGHAEGDLGWFVDDPVYLFGPMEVDTRLTAVLHREDGAWKIVHMHVSVGVPDGEVGDLQARWASEGHAEHT